MNELIYSSNLNDVKLGFILSYKSDPNLKEKLKSNSFNQNSTEDWIVLAFSETEKYVWYSKKKYFTEVSGWTLETLKLRYPDKIIDFRDYN